MRTFFREKRIDLLVRPFGLELGYFISSGFWVTSRYAVVSLLGILLTVAFARLGTKELYGEYQAIISFVGLLSVLSLPGLNMAALKAVALGEDGAIGKTVRYSFFASLLSVPVLLGYVLFGSSNSSEAASTWALVLAAFLAPFFFAPNTWYVFYEGRMLFRPVMVRSLAMSLCLTAALIALLYMKAGLIPLILAFFSVQILFQWFFLWEIRRQIFSVATRIFDLKYGLAVTGQKFVFLLTENLPILAVATLFGFAALAIFQIAYFFVNALSGLLSGLSATYLPLLFRETKPRHFATLLQQLSLGLVFFLVFRLLVEIFFLPIYGAEYRESLELVRNLSYLVIILPLKTFLVSYYTAQNKNGAICAVYLVANALALAGLLLWHDEALIFGATFYLFTLNLFILVPLVGQYLYEWKARPA